MIGMTGPFDDEEFEAKMDADTLLEAQDIRRDASRVKRARKTMERKAERLENEAERLAGEMEPESAEERGYTSLGKMNLEGEDG